MHSNLEALPRQKGESYSLPIFRSLKASEGWTLDKKKKLISVIFTLINRGIFSIDLIGNALTIGRWYCPFPFYFLNFLEIKVGVLLADIVR